MHKVVPITVAKPLLLSYRTALNRAYEITKREAIKENSERGRFSKLREDEVISNVDSYWHYEKTLLKQLELLCSVNGDILLTADEYLAIDKLIKSNA